MKSYIIIGLLFCFESVLLTAQNMYSEKELEVFKQQVDKTKSIGREHIIYTAAKSISDNPEALINDDKTLISVWYNKISVKVEFKTFHPIIYLPYNTEYYYESTVNIILDRATGGGGSSISNITKKSLQHLFNTKLYLHTKEKELHVKEVLRLNNTNDEKYYLDIKKCQGIIIKEQKKYYIMQLGHTYPITYKIDKITGKIYDYSDLYANLYPTPAQPPIRKYGIEGKWIEMKK